MSWSGWPSAGLQTVESVDEIDSGTVLIRSHGVAPRELDRLREKGLHIVDATCVLVKRVQQIAKQLEEEGYEVVIIGEENHPEVQGVMGCVHDVVVVADEQDLRPAAVGQAGLGSSARPPRARNTSAGCSGPSVGAASAS